MKKLLLVLIVLLTAMYFTNPTKDDFVKFVKNHLDNQVENAGMMQAMMLKMFSQKISEMAATMTVRTDCFVFSVYTVEMGDETYRYLGIFTTFVPLQTKSPMPDDLK